MSALLASNLVFDTDQEALFELDELARGKNWASARVYKSSDECSPLYEVWLFEWDPQTNEEKANFIQVFKDIEAAKSFASSQLLTYGQ
jgi:hypothetical protein